MFGGSQKQGCRLPTAAQNPAESPPYTYSFVVEGRHGHCGAAPFVASREKMRGALQGPGEAMQQDRDLEREV